MTVALEEGVQEKNCLMANRIPLNLVGEDQRWVAQVDDRLGHNKA